MADEIFAFDEDTPVAPPKKDRGNLDISDLSDLSLDDPNKGRDTPIAGLGDEHDERGGVSPPHELKLVGKHRHRRSKGGARGSHDAGPFGGRAESAPARSMLDAMGKSPGGVSHMDAAAEEAALHAVVGESKHHVLVIKNIPFNVRNKEFMDVISNLGVAPPQSVHYHIDANHKFRGMAFAIYKTVESAEAAMDVVQGLDVQGRKLRVEFKRHGGQKAKAAEADVPQEELSHIKEQLKLLKEDPTVSVVEFPTNYSVNTRKYIHQMAEKMGFTHRSQGDDTERYISVERRSPDEMKAAKKSKAINININGGKENGAASSIPGSYDHSPADHMDMDIRLSQSLKPRSSFGRHMATSMEDRGPSRSYGTSLSNSFTDGSPMQRRMWKRKESGPTTMGAIQVTRQPKGPDGTKGFTLARTLTGDDAKNKRNSLNPNAKHPGMSVFLTPTSPVRGVV